VEDAELFFVLIFCSKPRQYNHRNKGSETKAKKWCSRGYLIGVETCYTYWIVCEYLLEMEREMGLDQYLYASTFRASFDWRGEENKRQFNEVSEALNAGSLMDKVENGTATIQFKVGQWRKANHIHKWFVDNVQHGEDDCREYSVSRESLQELKELCLKVMADQSQAESLLPREQGFFFGSEEVDEWYFEDVKYTLELIDHLLTDKFEDYEFHYQSSW
jgi:uncharacterized protein YneR